MMSLFSLTFNLHSSSDSFSLVFLKHIHTNNVFLWCSYFLTMYSIPSPLAFFPIPPPLDLSSSIFSFLFFLSLNYFSWILFPTVLPSRSVVFQFYVHQDDLEERLKQSVGPPSEFLISGLGPAWEYASFQIMLVLPSFKNYYCSMHCLLNPGPAGSNLLRWTLRFLLNIPFSEPHSTYTIEFQKCLPMFYGQE